MRLIDTHSHIYLKQFNEDIDQVIANAKAANITDIYLPNIDIDSIVPLKLLSDHYDCCHPMLGLHPCSVGDNYLEVLKTMEKEFKKYDYIGVGEVGVDLYWEKKYFEEQKKAFQRQIDWGIDMNLPVIIHSRDSLDITIEMISNSQKGNLKGIFHCFNGTEDQAKKIIDCGFLMGLGGVLTYKNSGVDKAIENISLENFVLETDAPYLSPVPHRGKRNEPAYVFYVAKKLAEVKNVSEDLIADITTANAINLFGNTPM